MNDERRKAIAKIIGNLQEIVSELETVRDAEREAFDNRPESFQQSDAGQEAEEKCGALETAVDELESIIGNLEEAGT